MAAIDYDKIPESDWIRLGKASYNLARKLFEDPQVQKEYEIWLAERKAKEKNMKQK